MAEALDHRYDIAARIPSDASRELTPLMLQSLLKDRFRLKVHRESKVIPLYAMVVAPGGLKLKDARDEGAESGCTRSFATAPGATHSADCSRMMAADIAQAITALAPGYFDRPVIDATGLTGIYDLTLELVSLAESMRGKDGATIFKAIERLGLKLEPSKQAMDIVVVDEADSTPSDN